jgi:hypothetical protein
VDGFRSSGRIFIGPSPPSWRFAVSRHFDPSDLTHPAGVPVWANSEHWQLTETRAPKRSGSEVKRALLCVAGDARLQARLVHGPGSQTTSAHRRLRPARCSHGFCPGTAPVRVNAVALMQLSSRDLRARATSRALIHGVPPETDRGQPRARLWENRDGRAYLEHRHAAVNRHGQLRTNGGD